MSKISFNNKKNPFFKSLKEKVEFYFSSKKIASTGNTELYFKSVLQVATALGLYIPLGLPILFNGLIPTLIGFVVMTSYVD